MNKVLLLLLLIFISFVILSRPVLPFETESFKNSRLEREELEKREFSDEVRIRASGIVKNIRYKLNTGYNHGSLDLSKFSHV